MPYAHAHISAPSFTSQPFSSSSMDTAKNPNRKQTTPKTESINGSITYVG